MTAKVFTWRLVHFDTTVRVGPAPHNQELFDWFLGNLPIRTFTGQTVVGGFSFFHLSVPLKIPAPWKNDNDLVREDISEMPVGRINFFLTAGLTAGMCMKWGPFNEPMSYPTWAQVVAEDLPTLQEVGRKAWDNMMTKKDIMHVEMAA